MNEGKEHKIKKKDYQIFLSKLVIIGLLIVLQLAFFIVAYIKFSDYFAYIQGFMSVVSLLVVLYIINRSDNPAYKLAWTVPILIFPIIGGPLYLSLAGNRTRKKFANDIIATNEKAAKKYLIQDPAVQDSIKKQDTSVYAQSKYISDFGTFPVYQHTETTYFPIGEKYYEELLHQLEQAEHFIFLEYFIIQGGIVWDSVLQILVKKVAQGVDVRLIYDDIGCVTKLPPLYVNELRSMGIQCINFNPFIPVINLRQNNRDHRKIVVIDGHTAFTGGINLADEYINAVVHFGHWKDTGIMLKGEAVWNFTVMFLQMWEYLTKEEEDYTKYKMDDATAKSFHSDGYIQPYGDAPIDNEIVGENIYLNIINRAKDYVYITTPYLVIDNEMISALCLAAKSGIDVRIITPGIPDKKYVYLVTKSYYRQLIEAGVSIYQYTPGFIHAKNFVCDDEIATVGTVNMDFRSLYLHFECGVWMYQSHCVGRVKQDFLETLKECQHITLDDCLRKNFFTSLYQSILKLFAPLM